MLELTSLLIQTTRALEVNIVKFLIILIIPITIIPVLTNCTSSADKVEIIEISNQKSTKNINISKMAPGQVALQATVIEINKLASKTVLSILVKKVLEYGSATPPIANGSKLIVFADDGIFNIQVHNNELITLVMRHILLGPGEEHDMNWQILRFK